MGKGLRWKTVVFLIVLAISVIGRGFVASADSVSQTEVSRYALSWADNKNIPYVYGGSGRSMDSLEEVAKKKAGLDCSGFTRLVYKHFGINIAGTSSTQKESAKKVFTDISKAVPGDVVWWEGHVAIYIGDKKIVHTNTKRPPTNYPHVSSVYYRKDEKPTFLRMVDDVNKLKPLSGSASEETSDKVSGAKVTGSVVTESDLTGLVIEETLEEYQNTLPEITELSDTEKQVMEIIKDDIKSKDMSIVGKARVGVVFLGLVIIFYGVLLLVAYMFDRSNNLFDISLLGILTLGRYRLWDEFTGVSPGFSESSGIMYCDRGIIIKRVVLLEFVGFLLVGGFMRFI